MTNKIETKKTKVNLKADRIQLLGEKNSLIVKKEEFRTKIATLNAINIPIYSHQDPFLKLM